MKSIVGYVLRGHDISAELFVNAASEVVCPRCKSRVDHLYIPPPIRINPSQKYGVGNTRDLQQLLSAPLLKLIDETTSHKFDRYLVCEDPAYFYVRVHECIEFDAERRKTKFGAPCAKCGLPGYVVGATPAYLKCHSLPDNGFFRTDLEFGGGSGKSPLLIVGKALKQKIESIHFRGVYFHDAYGL